MKQVDPTPDNLYRALEIHACLSKVIPFKKTLTTLATLRHPLVIETITHEYGHYFAPPFRRPDLGDLEASYPPKKLRWAGVGKDRYQVAEPDGLLDLNERYARMVDIVAREFLGMDHHHLLTDHPFGGDDHRPGGKFFKIADLDFGIVMELAKKVGRLILETAHERQWPEEWFKTKSGPKVLRVIEIAKLKEAA